MKKLLGLILAGLLMFSPAPVKAALSGGGGAATSVECSSPDCIDDAEINWTDVEVYGSVNTQAINWTEWDITGRVSRSSINWTDVELSPVIDSGGINWTSIEDAMPINTEGINWTDWEMDGRINSASVNWDDVEVQQAAKGINWTHVEVNSAINSAAINWTDIQGAQNYLAKWGSSSPGDSVIYDNGTNIGVGTTSPTTFLEVHGPDTGTGQASAGGVVSQITDGLGRAVAIFRGGRDGTTPATNSALSLGGGASLTYSLATTHGAILATAGGNVGIGSSNPRGKLDLTDSGQIYADGSNLLNVTVGDGTVSTVKLKTTTGEVSTTSTSGVQLTLPGGSYGFYPQIKAGNGLISKAGAWIRNTTGAGFSTSYITNIEIESDGTYSTYAQQRYVTASGQDYWIFALLQKSDGSMISNYCAADHPSYGNGNDPDLLSTPFGEYDDQTYDVCIVEKEDVQSTRSLASSIGKTVASTLNENCIVSIDENGTYTPLHLGWFDENGDPVMLNSLPESVQLCSAICSE